MTEKQKRNQARFKKVVAEAKKLRAKNPKLTQAEAVKKAWAMTYGTVAGYEKTTRKGSKTTVTYTNKTAKKKAAKKPTQGRLFGAGTHKDTKSHNVNIRVVSGIEKTINGMKRKYIAVYETKNQVVSDAIFEALSLQEAKLIANVHKRHSPEISKHKNVRTSVKLYKNA